MKWLWAAAFVACKRVRESWPIDNIVDYIFGWVKDVRSRVHYPHEHDIVELPERPPDENSNV